MTRLTLIYSNARAVVSIFFIVLLISSSRICIPLERLELSFSLYLRTALINGGEGAQTSPTRFRVNFLAELFVLFFVDNYHSPASSSLDAPTTFPLLLDLYSVEMCAKEAISKGLLKKTMSARRSCTARTTYLNPFPWIFAIHCRNWNSFQ